MDEKTRYYEIASDCLRTLLNLVNEETRTDRVRLVSIVQLTDDEYERRITDAELEKEHLIELEDRRERVFNDAEGRLLSEEEWEELDGVLPGGINWAKFDPSNLGPYIAIVERIPLKKDEQHRTGCSVNIDGESLKSIEPNIDDITPF